MHREIEQSCTNFLSFYLGNGRNLIRVEKLAKNSFVNKLVKNKMSGVGKNKDSFMLNKVRVRNLTKTYILPCYLRK